MDEVSKLIERSKALIAEVKASIERQNQLWEQQKRERAMRRRSGQPVIRVRLARHLRSSSDIAEGTLDRVLPSRGGKW